MSAQWTFFQQTKFDISKGINIGSVRREGVLIYFKFCYYERGEMKMQDGTIVLKFSHNRAYESVKGKTEQISYLSFFIITTCGCP